MEDSEYLKRVEEVLETVRSGKREPCPCVVKTCEWHGKCFECVMIHRLLRNHVPECLRPLLDDKIEQLARTVEMKVTRV